jgi:hypothetical protein
VAEKLAVVGADGSAQALVVAEDGSEAEGEHGGVLKTIGDDAGVVNSGFLVEDFSGVVFADNDGKIAGGIKKNLVSTDSQDGFHGNRFAMAGQFRKSLFFTDTVGIP